jgi:hypothetical protein
MPIIIYPILNDIYKNDKNTANKNNTTNIKNNNFIIDFIQNIRTNYNNLISKK